MVVLKRKPGELFKIFKMKGVDGGEYEITGKRKFRTTITNKGIEQVLLRNKYYIVSQYEQVILQQFKKIPEYYVLPRKKAQKFPYFYQLTTYKYIASETEEAIDFAKHIETIYDRFLFNKTPKQRAYIVKQIPVSTVLSALQRLKTAESAEYYYLKKLLGITAFKRMLEMSILVKLDLSHIRVRKALVYLHKQVFDY